MLDLQYPGLEMTNMAEPWIGLACVITGVAAMTIPARRVAVISEPA
jgi:hypothetical protein